MSSTIELVKVVHVQTNLLFIFILGVCLTFQVRREYRKFFRANAGRKIYEFTLQRLVCIYLYKVHVHFLCFKFLFSVKCHSCVMIVFVRKCPSTWKSDKLIFWYCKERIVIIFGGIGMVQSICRTSVIPKSAFLNIPGFKNPYSGLWELRVAVWYLCFLITEHLLFLVHCNNSDIWTLIKHLASILSQMQKYFLEMKNKMPSLSPIDKNWPTRPYLFLDSTHTELKRIFHLWRVGHILVQSVQNFFPWFSTVLFTKGLFLGCIFFDSSQDNFISLEGVGFLITALGLRGI